MAEQKEHVKAYIKVTGHKYAWMLECGGDGFMAMEKAAVAA